MQPLVDLTADLREMARMAARCEPPDDLLRRGLVWLSRLAPYDLATIFMLEGDELQLKLARGELAGRVDRHRVPLQKFPAIRQALEDRRARAFTEADHASGDLLDGVLDLTPGHACMVAPLWAGDNALGLLALDRRVCEPYPPEVVDLVEIYAALLALALDHARQRSRWERLHRQEAARAQLLEGELTGDVVLEDSRSPGVRALAYRARQVAATDTPVLLAGETGTGKGRLAWAIHRWSRRAEGPFVSVNCAAIPASLIESELFGHVKGAFTGAVRDRLGRFAVANGGTLLLDEIGELSPDCQAKLLRVLQEGTLLPVGADREVRVDVRVLAATHRDLEADVGAGRFREDLYYRLAVFPLRLPPLRERVEDLPALCELLLAEQARRTGRGGMRVSEPGLALLAGYHWPGNIRQLANVLERATILAPPGERALGPDALDLPRAPEPRPPQRRGASDPEPVLTMDEAQRRCIERALERAGGRIYGEGGAAELLRMKPTTLQSRMKKLKVRRLHL